MTKANHLKDFLVGLVGVAVFFGVLYLLLNPEHMVLERWVAPAGGIDIPTWLEEFDDVQFYWVFVVSAVLAVVWVALTSFVDSGFKGDRRGGWLLLYVLAILAAAYAAFYNLPETGAGRSLAVSLALLNGLATFWLMTVLTSAQTHKFAPFLSAHLRKRW